MRLARPRFPVLFSLRGFLGQVFPGHPGTLHAAFRFISFAVVFFFFFSIMIKVGYGVAPRPYPIFHDLLPMLFLCFSTNF